MPSVALTTANSTAPGASPAVNLDWIGGKPCTVALSFNASATIAVAQIQYTLDDLQRVPSTAVTWLTVATTAALAAPVTYIASNYFDTGVSIAFLNPIAAVRMFSTGITAGASQQIFMDVLQGVGG
jgi:hypothetical protein